MAEETGSPGAVPLQQSALAVVGGLIPSNVVVVVELVGVVVLASVVEPPVVEVMVVVVEVVVVVVVVVVPVTVIVLVFDFVTPHLSVTVNVTEYLSDVV